MIKRLSSLLALVFLCLLLIYAPKLYAAVSGPSVSSSPDRILLRVVLCTDDPDSASSLYSALKDFRKQNPSVHLRITRADEDQLSSLPSPLPDVYIFPEDASLPLSSLFRPFHDSLTQRFCPAKGEPLLCAVSRATLFPNVAARLAASLCPPVSPCTMPALGVQ